MGLTLDIPTHRARRPHTRPRTPKARRRGRERRRAHWREQNSRFDSHDGLRTEVERTQLCLIMVYWDRSCFYSGRMDWLQQGQARTAYCKLARNVAVS